MAAKTKTVIHVWTHYFNIRGEHLRRYNYLKETNFYFGLGDLIRSTIKLFHLSKVMNFNFFVDIQLHPISEFLLQQNNGDTLCKFVLDNRNCVEYVCYGAVEDYISKTSTNDDEILLILTNDFFDEAEIGEDCRNFIRNIFTPKPKFQRFIDMKMSCLPYKKYNVMHYRLSDNEFLQKKNKEDNDVLEKLLGHLKRNKEECDVLITDTKALKDYFFLHDTIFFFDLKICHLGLSEDSDAVRDTLFEFFLLTKASKIKTYCKIHKVSGFVRWVSEVYSIPITTFN